MNIEEVIEQLESLKANQRDFIEKENLEDVFYKDVIAIEKAIKIMKEIIKLSNQCYEKEI